MTELIELPLGKTFLEKGKKCMVVERFNKNCDGCLADGFIECLICQCHKGESGNDVDVKIVEISEKPLFLPLKSFYYDQFEEGRKDTEYRKYGKRWNEKTCYPGRKVTVSRGYGKSNRLNKSIESIKIINNPSDIPGWKECYGDDPSPCIAIKLKQVEG